MSPTNPADNQLRNARALAIDHLPMDWRAILSETALGNSLATITAAIRAEQQAGMVHYPAQPWRALALTPLASVKLVILGQDPYHGPGQAQGLAFSVNAHQKIPPSLRNIFKEIANDPLVNEDQLRRPPSPDLTRWAEQGVLLLNTSLTVRDGEAGSHAKLGWQIVTDALIQAVAKRDAPTVFMLWGAHAQAKADMIKAAGPRHLILQANHPSPLSATRPPRPFIGCGHFGMANKWLRERAIEPVRW